MSIRLFLINSPVVRGDNLRFREAGVKEVVSRALLPWLNSFRFFLGSVALLEKEHGVKFSYDGTAAQSKNVMDRWLLARCQTLIQHVGEEMAGKNDHWVQCSVNPDDSCSIPPLHCRSSTSRSRGRAHELVCSLQPPAVEGRKRTGRCCCRSHLPVRSPSHSLSDTGKLPYTRLLVRR